MKSFTIGPRAEFIWKRVRRCLFWLGIPSGFLAFLGETGLLPAQVYELACYIMAILCYVMGIPVSIIVRLDKLASSLGISVGYSSLLLCLSIAVLNVAFLSLLRSFLVRDKLETKKTEQKSLSSQSGVKPPGAASQDEPLPEV